MSAVQWEVEAIRPCETVYGLKRNLVASLQRANRGVPRRQRFLMHRAFAEAWGWFATRGRLGAVLERMRNHGPVPMSGGDWEEEAHMAFLAELGRGKTSPGEPIGATGGSTSEPGAASGSRSWPASPVPSGAMHLDPGGPELLPLGI